MRTFLTSLALLITATASLGADWNPELAARYLDGRQKEWFSWKPALQADGPCVSCHTGMTYLLARPALRRKLKEREPTMYERGLMDRLRTNVGAKPAGALQTVESIFAAMFLSGEDAKNTMSAHTQKAFDQLWQLQDAEGPGKAWKWYAANLDPWENPESRYYGASLAAIAIANTPAKYRESADVKPRVALLTTYLASPASTPRLHDRLALLWASASMPSLLSDTARRAILIDTFAAQQADGGWTLESLGPWLTHTDPALPPGSDAYATAFATFALQRSGVKASDKNLGKAIAWLQSRQDPKTGAWPAVSMNKRRPEGSMESLFMQDAATAFASLALIEAGR